MTPAIAAAAPAEVKWVTARHEHSCGECTAEIVPSDRMAFYQDVFVTLSAGELSEHRSIERIYCEACGHLLEDSLTTTEAFHD